MAIKDWKKTGKDEWHLYTNTRPMKIIDGVFIVKTIGGKYTIDSYYRPYRIKNHSFNTKAQALKSLKSYMKKCSLKSITKDLDLIAKRKKH